MADRELKKMNRKELFELLIALKTENEQLKERLQEQTVQLQNRDIQVKKAGSLAEAALALNDIFENADKAAAQYLVNIKRYGEQQKSNSDKIVLEAEKKAKEILDRAELERQRKIREADAYWKSLSSKLEQFYQEHPGMRELLAAQSKKKSEKNEKK